MSTLSVLLVSPLALAGPALEDITYTKMVEIVRVQAVRAPEKRYNLEVTFNLFPDMPKGLKVEFELQCQGLKVGDETFWFTLESDNRKNLKLTIAPKARLTVDRYLFMTRIPLDDQSPEVRAVIEGKPARFPPEHNPWPFAHPQQEITVGTPEDEKAELAEVSEYVETHLQRLLELNAEAVEEFERQRAGKLDQEALKKFLKGWAGKMAETQIAVASFPQEEPGLYFKHQKVHLELQQLGRLIGKRFAAVELRALLKKHNLAATHIPPPAVEGFDPNFNYRATKADIEAKVKLIDQILNPSEEAGEPETETEGEPGSEKAPGGGKKEAGKEEEGDGGEDEAGKEGGADEKSKKPAPEGKKGEKGKPQKTPKGSKQPEKKPKA